MLKPNPFFFSFFFPPQERSLNYAKSCSKLKTHRVHKLSQSPLFTLPPLDLVLGKVEK